MIRPRSAPECFGLYFFTPAGKANDSLILESRCDACLFKLQCRDMETGVSLHRVWLNTTSAEGGAAYLLEHGVPSTLAAEITGLSLETVRKHEKEAKKKREKVEAQVYRTQKRSKSSW